MFSILLPYVAPSHPPPQCAARPPSNHQEFSATLIPNSGNLFHQTLVTSAPSLFSHTDHCFYSEAVKNYANRRKCRAFILKAAAPHFLLPVVRACNLMQWAADEWLRLRKLSVNRPGRGEETRGGEEGRDNFSERRKPLSHISPGDFFFFKDLYFWG